MQNLNILPRSTVVGDIDDVYALMGRPPYIIAEGLLVTYYLAQSSVGGIQRIAVAVCPTRSDYSLLDADSKSVGTYQKPPKNQFDKKGAVIVCGGAGTPDEGNVYWPTAVYNTKEKKFMVYYIGVNGAAVASICLASGKAYNQLVKHTSDTGVVTPVITAPAGTTMPSQTPMVVFDKEENLYKVYYNVTAAGGQITSYLSTSKNGYDF